MKEAISANINSAKKRKAHQDLISCYSLKKSKSVSDAVTKVNKKGSDAVPKVTKKGPDAVPEVTKKGPDAVPEVTKKGSDAVPMVTKKRSDAVPKKGSDAVPKKRSDAVPKKTSDAVPRKRSDAVPKKRSDAVPKKGSDAVPKFTKKRSDAVPRVTKKGSATVPMVTKKGSDAVPKVNKKGSATVPKDNKTTFITFDLETTGLIQDYVCPHITQIAAIEIESSKSFSTYVLPKKPIGLRAQELTGIEVNDCNEMQVNGQPVDPAPIEDALQKLFEWLDNFTNVVLVAHNGSKFDFPVMFSALKNTNNAEAFLKRVTGWIDSLLLFREHFPYQSSYRQEDLVDSLLDISFDAHNAIDDVETLGKLIKLTLTKLSPEELLSHSISPEEFTV